MTRARACRQTRFRLLWVHCHLGLPCHRAPLLCRTIAVPLLVQPRPDTLLSTYSPSPHVDHDHDHHHLTTTKPPPLACPPRPARPAAEPNLNPTPHTCACMHTGPPHGGGGVARRLTARASTAGRARRTRPSWPWCSPRGRSGAPCRKGVAFWWCLRSLPWPPRAGIVRPFQP